MKTQKVATVFCTFCGKQQFVLRSVEGAEQDVVCDSCEETFHLAAVVE